MRVYGHFGERDSFVQHVKFTDVVGENEDELGFEGGGFGVVSRPAGGRECNTSAIASVMSRRADPWY